MLQPGSLKVFALVGLLAGAAANAGERSNYRGDIRENSWTAPQIQLGVNVLWGGYGYAPPRPPVVLYPARYATARYYDQGSRHASGRGHRKHRHHAHRGRDCDD